MTERVCENCGVPDDELMTVRRIYVTPESWDAPREERVQDEPELWCLSCASQYPHQVTELPEGEDGGRL